MPNFATLDSYRVTEQDAYLARLQQEDILILGVSDTYSYLVRHERTCGTLTIPADLDIHWKFAVSRQQCDAFARLAHENDIEIRETCRCRQRRVA
jgi:hypothetical protein